MHKGARTVLCGGDQQWPSLPRQLAQPDLAPTTRSRFGITLLPTHIPVAPFSGPAQCPDKAMHPEQPG